MPKTVRSGALFLGTILFALLLRSDADAAGRAGDPGPDAWRRASTAVRKRTTVLKRFHKTRGPARDLERELDTIRRTLGRLEKTTGSKAADAASLAVLAKRIVEHEARLGKLLGRLPRAGDLFGGTTPDDVIEALRDLEGRGPESVAGRLFLVLRQKGGACKADGEAFIEVDVGPGAEPSASAPCCPPSPSSKR